MRMSNDERHFLGSFYARIDGGGRFSLPSSFQQLIEGEVYVYASSGGRLILMTPAAFLKMLHREFSMAGCCDAETYFEQIKAHMVFVGNHGSIKLPQTLLDIVGINRRVVLLGRLAACIIIPMSED
jgi:DNA-binding transcriptional regulator/RsmH inhibitor MraZ